VDGISNKKHCFFFFSFYWAPVAGTPGSTAAMKALKVSAFTASNPHAYDARDL
jgi:hypothetical protein